MLVLSIDGNIFTKSLRLEKAIYGTRKLVAEFPNKTYTSFGLSYNLRKIDATDSVERRQDSGIKRTMRTRKKHWISSGRLSAKKVRRNRSISAWNSKKKNTDISQSSIFRFSATTLEIAIFSIKTDSVNFENFLTKFCSVIAELFSIILYKFRLNRLRFSYFVTKHVGLQFFARTHCTCEEQPPFNDTFSSVT